MGKIIKIKGLKKYFGDIKAVDDVSFDIEKGSLFALLGLNGAGKSTLINIICSILAKDEGEVEIAGYDIDCNINAIKKEIGIVFQGSILDDKLSVKDNLSIRASLYGIYGETWKKRLVELDKMLSLGGIIKRPYGKLSGGQRRRVDIARSLIHSPSILILDEPTTGLDPQTRRTVWEVINKLRQEQCMTVMLTTHYMEEANQADNVVIIDNGKVVANDNPITLKNKYSGDYVKIYCEKSNDLNQLLTKRDFSYENNHYLVKIINSDDAKAFIREFDKYLTDFELVKGDMDDVFLKVTGKKLDGGEQV